MNVRITDVNGKKPTFVQWDVDRILFITGCDSQPCLHFFNALLDRAIVVQAEEDGSQWKCRVPNFILQFEESFVVSVFVQPDEGKTVLMQLFHIDPKLKPQDYTYEENIGYINWVEKSEQAEELLARFDELRAEIAEAVETADASKSQAVEAAAAAAEAADTATAAAEDAGQIAQNVGKDIESIRANNTFNILDKATLSGRTHNGVTYEWQEDGSCEVSGTATALSFCNIWSSTTSLPTWFAVGKKYWVKFSAANISLKIWFYKNGVYSSGFSVTKDRIITVPEDIEGLILRLQVENGLTANETVHPIMLNAPSSEEAVAAAVYCPELTESQKGEILSLISAYEAEKSNTVYYFNATHNSYASKDLAYDGSGKLRLCCTTFAEMIWGGVSPDTFFDDPSAYAGNIAKAFDWGYFNPYTVRRRAARLANRSGATVTGLYGFTSPDGEDGTAFAYNTRYAENGELQNSQTWLGFLNAADFASELYINGYEIPASKADVGDLVFYEAAPYSVNALYNVSFRRIFHVAVITAKINGFFEVVEATSADNGNGPLIRRSIFSSDDFCCAKSAFMQNRAVMFARHPSAYGAAGNVPSKFSTISTRV